jgi:hypothetical protein
LSLCRSDYWGGVAVNSITKACIALALAVPAISFAQAQAETQANPQSLTRDQVRAQLVQAESAGYSPTAWADFPYGEVQAAEFRVSARRAAADPTGYGADWNGSSQSGDIAR